ncbi:MAG: LytTR family DNA-binding domain-containing protein [Psychroflexus sp.]|jgi:DNA-binding LytR/AlgR family response regulator|nr:LytTR family DNA-binding domain-containing protein [Psychroflexus sp.]MDR9449566.1 LytTR family DNA-binding domain-containing protein [Psychroflexus sp.]
MTTKALIVEDENPSARRLQRLLEKYDFEIIQRCGSLKATINWLKAHQQPDVVFLDIQLGDGLSFELFNEVDMQCPIIFTTAYDQYAIQAFKYNSIDYLLKPIDEDELVRAIDQLKQHQQPLTANQIKQLMQQSQEQKKYKERFTVKVGEHIKVFKTQDIALFYSQDKANYLLLKNGRNYLVDQTLEELDQLLSPSDFFRISRKFIVHYPFIEEVINYSNSRLRVKLNVDFNEVLIVSRERVKDFKAWLEGV